MRYLLDTNILSELRKGERCDTAVAAWAQAELMLHQGAMSVIALGEIRKGIELITRRDPAAAANLNDWLDGLCARFGERILPISAQIADEWGRLNARRPLPAADSLLAATANVHRLILATRNTADLRQVEVKLVNPFEYRAG